MPFPSSLPSYAGFTSTHTLQADNHAAQSNQEQADITAIATKVGTGASTPTSTSVLVGNGGGTSAWGQIALSNMVSGVLPVGNGGTGISSLGSGVATFLGAPTSANLAAALTDETGTGSNVFANTPSLVTPVISDFSNAIHNHTNNANGGLLNGANAIIDGTLTPNELVASAGTSWVAQSILPNFTGFSVNPIVSASFIQIGKTIIYSVYPTVNGTSNANTFTISAPVISSNAAPFMWYAPATVVDSGSTSANPGQVSLPNNSTTITVSFNWSQPAIWTSSGAKSAAFTLIYQAA